MKHYRPSFLGNLAQCARCVADDDGPENKAASDGTLFHKDMYDMISSCKPSQYEEHIASLTRSDDHKDMMRAARTEADAYLCLGLQIYTDKKFRYEDNIDMIPPGIYLECAVELWPDDRQHKIGIMDMLVVLQPGHAVIVDWKSNRTDSDFSWQLASYAGALRRICSSKWTQITGKIIAPNLGQQEDIIFDDAAIIAAEKEILQIEDRANNPFTPPCPGEKACKYCRCKRLGQCPAILQSSVAGMPSPANIPTDIVVQKDTDLEDYYATVRKTMDRAALVLKPGDNLELRSLRRDWSSIASMFVDYVKDDDKKYFQKPENGGKILPGYTVSTREGNRQLDKTKLSELNQAIQNAFGLSNIEMFSYLEPNKELLLEKMALKFGTRRAAEEKYSEVVDEFTVRGAPITTIRRESARKLIKLKTK